MQDSLTLHQWVVLSLFIMGYLCIIFEHTIGVNKTTSALFTATIWMFTNLEEGKEGILKEGRCAPPFALQNSKPHHGESEKNKKPKQSKCYFYRHNLPPNLRGCDSFLQMARNHPLTFDDHS